MPNSNENIRLQVLINGEVVATGGMESFGVLSMSCTWVRRDLADATDEHKAKSWYSDEAWIGNRTDFQFGGLDSVRSERLEWRRCELFTGDKVTIHVLPPGEFDEPVERVSRS